MADFEGRLGNAPVVYVLCQIRFAPIVKMVDYVPEIQEALRSQYPKFESDQLSGLAFASNFGPMMAQSETRWRFETRDSQTGFMLSADQLITHTTSYVDSDDFRNRVLLGFRIIHEVAKISFIQRIGLRYIDLITASADEAIESYIDPSLIGFRPSIPGLTPDVSQQFLRAQATVGGAPSTLLVKVSRARHASELPADLMPISLGLGRKPPPDADSIFLDWDHYVEQRNLDPDPKLLEGALRELKEPIAAIFKAAITKFAVKQWE